MLREHILCVRFSDVELKTVMAAAKVEGINRAELIRHSATAHAKRVLRGAKEGLLDSDRGPAADDVVA